MSPADSPADSPAADVAAPPSPLSPGSSPDLADVVARLAAVVDRLADGPAPEGLRTDAAAKYCGVKPSFWRSMTDRGLNPAPAQAGDGGRCPIWSRRELAAWIVAGMPARVKWNAIRDTAIRRLGAA